MLSVEPILERTFRISGAGAAPGRAVVLAVREEVFEEVVRAVRVTRGFFSGTVPVVEDCVASLVVVVRGRDAVVLDTELRVVVEVEVLGLVESAGGRVNHFYHLFSTLYIYYKTRCDFFFCLTLWKNNFKKNNCMISPKVH